MPGSLIRFSIQQRRGFTLLLPLQWQLPCLSGYLRLQILNQRLLPSFQRFRLLPEPLRFCPRFPGFQKGNGISRLGPTNS